MYIRIKIIEKNNSSVNYKKTMSYVGLEFKLHSSIFLIKSIITANK